MVEYTVTYNIEVTEVIKGSREDEERLMNPQMQNDIASLISSTLNADDVHINDYKVFPMEINNAD